MKYELGLLPSNSRTPAPQNYPPHAFARLDEPDGEFVAVHQRHVAVAEFPVKATGTAPISAGAAPAWSAPPPHCADAGRQ
jgi:hypothetical protein